MCLYNYLSKQCSGIDNENFKKTNDPLKCFKTQIESKQICSSFQRLKIAPTGLFPIFRESTFEAFLSGILRKSSLASFRLHDSRIKTQGSVHSSEISVWLLTWSMCLFGKLPVSQLSQTLNDKIRNLEKELKQDCFFRLEEIPNQHLPGNGIKKHM